jgi:hypothetical protein
MNKKLLVALLLAIAFLFGRKVPEPLNDDGNYFPYRAMLAVDKDHLPLNQGAIGTCVAVAHKGMKDCLDAVDVVNGKLRKWLPVSAESIYGGARNEARGAVYHSRSDGANGYNAKKWMVDVGGVLYESDVGAYDIKRAKLWGAESNGGDGTISGPLDREAEKNPVKAGAKITTLDEADKALKNAKFITICSNVGFNSPRDADGFCRPRGAWSHCMLVIGKRNEGRKGYLIQNSWGAYIAGDGPISTNKYKDQPDGSFYVEPSVLQLILNAGDSWAYSNQDDFKGELPAWMLAASAVAPQFEPMPDPISTPGVVPVRSADCKCADCQCADCPADCQPKPKAANNCGPNGCSSRVVRRGLFGWR